MLRGAGRIALMVAVTVTVGSVWAIVDHTSRDQVSTLSAVSADPNAGSGNSPTANAVPDYSSDIQHPIEPVGLPAPLGCSQPHHPVVYADPPRGYPTSLNALADASQIVVRVKVTGQQAFWHHGQPNEGIMGWVPFTVSTLYSSDALKGPLRAVSQVVEEGARSGTISCSALAYIVGGEPLMEVGHEYILFLQAAGRLRDGMWRAAFGPLDRFEIRDGVVYPQSALIPDAWTAATPPAVVPDFVRSLGLGTA